MKWQFLLTSVIFAGIGNLWDFKAAKKTLARSESTREMTIMFQAMVGDRPFSCTRTYEELGQPATTAAATDFRFYVSDLALIDASGKVVPLKLTSDGKWQYQNVALLDFENKSGSCTNGTPEMRDRVTGTVPDRNYKGLKFTLGVPANLNHEDATLAPSPLNLTSLWWSWQSGYKFLRIDLTNPNQTSGNRAPGLVSFPIHLGSTGCQADSNTQKVTECENKNAPEVFFADFRPERNVVVADLKALVRDSNLLGTRADSASGCMSDPNDENCASIMANLGLPFQGNPSLEQTFFRIK